MPTSAACRPLYLPTNPRLVARLRPMHSELNGCRSIRHNGAMILLVGDTQERNPSVQLWTALADEAQRAICAASRGREGPRGNASGMGGSDPLNKFLEVHLKALIQQKWSSARVAQL